MNIEFLYYELLAILGYVINKALWLGDGEGFAGWGSYVFRCSLSIKTASSIVNTISICLRDGYRPGGGGVAGTVEHAAHICHFGSIPGGEVQSKVGGGVAGIIEHAAHICHFGSIPGGEVQSKVGGGVAGIREHVAHICHVGSIPRREI